MQAVTATITAHSTMSATTTIREDPMIMNSMNVSVSSVSTGVVVVADVVASEVAMLTRHSILKKLTFSNQFQIHNY